MLETFKHLFKNLSNLKDLICAKLIQELPARMMTLFGLIKLRKHSELLHILKKVGNSLHLKTTVSTTFDQKVLYFKKGLKKYCPDSIPMKNTKEDRQLFMRIANTAYRQSTGKNRLDENELNDFLANGVPFFLTTKEKGERIKVGTSQIYFHVDGSVRIAALSVFPSYQRRGIAKSTLSRVLKVFGNKEDINSKIGWGCAAFADASKGMLYRKIFGFKLVKGFIFRYKMCNSPYFLYIRRFGENSDSNKPEKPNFYLAY